MASDPRPLRLAIPNKGRLSEDAVNILKKAGIRIHGSSDRRLLAHALGGRLQVLFLRAQDIPRFVHAGSVDAGITGLDCVEEASVEVDRALDLRFGGCRLVVAVPDAMPATSTKELPSNARIATSFPEIVKRYCAEHGHRWRVFEVSGACEITPALGVADAIVDLTSSGSTLTMNKLREIETVLESSCHLIVNPDLQGETKAEYERLLFALRSVVDAAGRRYLLADVPRSALKEIESFLPGMGGPSVVELAGHPDKVAIQVVVEESQIFDAVHRLKQLGGEGIAVLPIDRIVA